jgi:hypothetical protein
MHAQVVDRSCKLRSLSPSTMTCDSQQEQGVDGQLSQGSGRWVLHTTTHELKSADAHTNADDSGRVHCVRANVGLSMQLLRRARTFARKWVGLPVATVSHVGKCNVPNSTIDESTDRIPLKASLSSILTLTLQHRPANCLLACCACLLAGAPRSRTYDVTIVD